jgi:hypothetical protein
MPARDIEADVRAIVADEAQKQSFTDDVGWAVTFDRVGIMNGNGMSYRTQWTIMLDFATGLVDPRQRRLGNTITVDRTQPDEEDLRPAIAATIEGLRQHRKVMRAGQNGQGKISKA